MTSGSEIEVVEGENFARIVMPTLPPRFQFVKGQRAQAWVAAVMMPVGPFLPIALAMVKGVHWSRVVHPRDTLDVVMVLIGAVMFLMFEGMMIGGMVAAWRQFHPQRVEIVVDRCWVGRRGWGPMDLFRVKVGAIRGIIVAATPQRRRMRKGAVPTKSAMVRVEAGRYSRSILLGYSFETAMEAARELARQMKRLSSVVVEVRDEFRETATLDGEGILRRGGVGMETMVEGVELRIGGLVRRTPLDAGKGFLMPRVSVYGGLVGFGMIGIGAMLSHNGQRTGVMTGTVMVGGLLVMQAWIVYVLNLRVLYRVGKSGVEKISTVVGIWRTRRAWSRVEIREVFERDHRTGRAAGLVLGGGRRVVLTVGSVKAVEEFANVLRRELGLVGESVGDRAGQIRGD